MYDALAPHYREYSANKAAYLEAVDKIIIERIPTGACSLLDVGAGDGVRAVRIAQARNISTLVLAEPSEAMVACCCQLPVTQVWAVSAENLPETEQRFDVITCLWNVLGHISQREDRLRALQKMRGLLNQDGVLFFDVNNRHNARAYGWFEVFKRVCYDLVCPNNTKGDATFHWSVDGKTIAAMGHVFTPGEVACLLQDANLKIRRRCIVDYRTGQQCGLVFEGQLLYEVDRRP